jgi:hypothetical protein
VIQLSFTVSPNNSDNFIDQQHNIKPKGDVQNIQEVFAELIPHFRGRYILGIQHPHVAAQQQDHLIKQSKKVVLISLHRHPAHQITQQTQAT